MINVRKIIYRGIKWAGCTVRVVQMCRATEYTSQRILKENATLRRISRHITVISARNEKKL